MRAVVEELFTEMQRAAVGTRPLWRLAARVYALRGYSFAPEDMMPLWCRPWARQFAKYLYRLAPPGLREFAGPYGMLKVVRDAAPELLEYLQWYYDIRQYKDAVLLIPLSADFHRDAVAELRDALTWAMRFAAGRGAQRIIEENGYLDWRKYIETLEEELKQRLAL